MAHTEYFLEVVSQIAGTTDTHSDEYRETLSMLEGSGQEKSAIANTIRGDIGKWGKAFKRRDPVIHNTKGDITKYVPDLKDLATTLLKGLADNESSSFGSAKETLKQILSLYAHFVSHKDMYTKAFTNQNEFVIGVYVAASWTMISYMTELVVCYNIGRANRNMEKFAKWIAEIKKTISSPNYVEYVELSEKSHMNTESLLFESGGILAIGAAAISALTLTRLIIWNIYNMRTKISDKLKVTAEYMEKNANRLKNTDRKNKDKIVARQLKSVDMLSKLANMIRIKTEEDKITQPPKLTGKTSSKENDTKKTDDVDDIEL